MYSAATFLIGLLSGSCSYTSIGPDGQQRAVAVLADHAQEVGIGDAVRLVDLALVAARHELLLRRRARRARGADQDRVRIGADELQHLAGDRRVVAVVLLLRDDLDARGLCRALHLGEPAIAVRVGEADVADRLDAVGLHVTAIASAIRASFCGVLKTHCVFGLAGSTIRAEAAIEIIGVLASATTSIIASELGVIVEPTITSTLFSLISLRVRSPPWSCRTRRRARSS